jgi:hypothetical protein
MELGTFNRSYSSAAIALAVLGLAMGLASSGHATAPAADAVPGATESAAVPSPGSRSVPSVPQCMLLSDVGNTKSCTGPTWHTGSVCEGVGGTKTCIGPSITRPVPHWGPCVGKNQMSTTEGYLDVDRDGFWLPTTGGAWPSDCSNALSRRINADGGGRTGDCDDTNPAINPDAPEICDDGIDNNCRLGIDTADPQCATGSVCTNGAVEACSVVDSFGTALYVGTVCATGERTCVAGGQRWSNCDPVGVFYHDTDEDGLGNYAAPLNVGTADPTFLITQCPLLVDNADDCDDTSSQAAKIPPSSAGSVVCAESGVAVCPKEGVIRCNLSTTPPTRYCNATTVATGLCNDNNACTTGETCQSGACTGGTNRVDGYYISGTAGSSSCCGGQTIFNYECSQTASTLPTCAALKGPGYTGTVSCTSGCRYNDSACVAPVCTAGQTESGCGECGDGQRTCDTSSVPYTWSACTGASAKIRYYKDVDDDVYGISTQYINACGPSGDFTATEDGDCNDADAAVNPGAVEICDGIDNDCNGTPAIDEEFPTKGAACTDGIGACADTGINVCTTDGTGVVCNATAGTGSTESCNNIDDDCDGTVDDFTQSCGTGLGVCAGATRLCSAGTLGTCSVTPGVEICNGLDDDCDGTVDNITTGGTLYYYDGDQDNYGTGDGRRLCAAGSTTVGSDPNYRYTATVSEDCADDNAQIHPGATERCHATDYNCDNDPYDGFPGDPNGACTPASDSAVSYDTTCQSVQYECSSTTAMTCSKVINKSGSISCDDGNACTTADSCSAGSCVGGPPLPCNDSDACTTDSCNTTSGCVNALIPADDGYSCTADACAAATGATHTASDAICTPTTNANPCAIYVGTCSPSTTGADATTGCVPPTYLTVGTAVPGDPTQLCCASGTDGSTAPGGAWYYRDADGDGYGVQLNKKLLCVAPSREDTTDPFHLNTANNADDCNDGWNMVFPGAVEICNRADDNCDGTVDLDAANALKHLFFVDVDREGRGSGTGVLRCYPETDVYGNEEVRYGNDCADVDASTRDQFGLFTLYPGTEHASTSPAHAEICDGKDNDCDGTVDNGGAMECVKGAAEVCGPGQVGGKVCNDSCQWNTAACELVICTPGHTKSCGTDDASQCPRQKTCNAQGTSYSACVNAVEPTKYFLDKDQDDFTPANAPFQMRCLPDAVTGYTEPAQTAADCNDLDETMHPNSGEVCDGKDNDCNGLKDDNVGNWDCVKGETPSQCETGQVGSVTCTDCKLVKDCSAVVCTAGTEPRVCGADDPDICDGTELCNADGTGWVGTCSDMGTKVTGYVDADGDGFGAGDLQTACIAGINWAQNANDCDDANTLVNPNANEICDGIDNNCDTQIDELFHTKGDACSAGKAGTPCANTGVYECNTAKNGVVCSARAHDPSPEICGNNIDDDCNGTVDDYTEDGVLITETATCGCNFSGNRVCQNNVMVCVGGEGATEICDGEDNDCDGTIDNGLSRACDGAIGLCTTGQEICAAGVWGTCSISAADEICDGLDNDCDGQTDEGLTRACEGALGVCAEGQEICGGGVYGACSIAGSAEVCDNALDDDCDGDVDSADADCAVAPPVDKGTDDDDDEEYVAPLCNSQLFDCSKSRGFYMPAFKSLAVSTRPVVDTENINILIAGADDAGGFQVHTVAPADFLTENGPASKTCVHDTPVTVLGAQNYGEDFVHFNRRDYYRSDVTLGETSCKVDTQPLYKTSCGDFATIRALHVLDVDGDTQDDLFSVVECATDRSAKHTTHGDDAQPLVSAWLQFDLLTATGEHGTFTARNLDHVLASVPQGLQLEHVEVVPRPAIEGVMSFDLIIDMRAAQRALTQLLRCEIDLKESSDSPLSCVPHTKGPMEILTGSLPWPRHPAPSKRMALKLAAQKELTLPAITLSKKSPRIIMGDEALTFVRMPFSEVSQEGGRVELQSQESGDTRMVIGPPSFSYPAPKVDELFAPHLFMGTENGVRVARLITPAAPGEQATIQVFTAQEEQLAIPEAVLAANAEVPADVEMGDEPALVFHEVDGGAGMDAIILFNLHDADGNHLGMFPTLFPNRNEEPTVTWDPEVVTAAEKPMNEGESWPLRLVGDDAADDTLTYAWQALNAEGVDVTPLLLTTIDGPNATLVFPTAETAQAALMLSPYTIQGRACDALGACSSWAELVIDWQGTATVKAIPPPTVGEESIVTGEPQVRGAQQVKQPEKAADPTVDPAEAEPRPTGPNLQFEAGGAGMFGCTLVRPLLVPDRSQTQTAAPR